LTVGAAVIARTVAARQARWETKSRTATSDDEAWSDAARRRRLSEGDGVEAGD
jgi:hypothetical protein